MKNILLAIDNPIEKLDLVMDLGRNLESVPNGASCHEILGCTSFVEPDVTVKGFQKDDILVLTSDGLTNMLTDEEIYNYISDLWVK